MQKRLYNFLQENNALLDTNHASKQHLMIWSPTRIDAQLDAAQHQHGGSAGMHGFEMTIPDKPRSRHQRYCLTALGVALRRRLEAPHG